MGYDGVQGIRGLIESSNGVHFTLYLRNQSGLEGLKSQIKRMLAEAEKELVPVMSPFEKKIFFAPLNLMLNSDRMLKSFNYNIGIFRTQKLFRIVSLPIEVQDSWNVATTFHVKPLLKWIREDKKFLVVGVSGSKVTLFKGSKTSIRRVDRTSIESSDLLDMIYRNPIPVGTRVFFVGPRKVFNELRKKAPSVKWAKLKVSDSLRNICWEKLRAKIDDFFQVEKQLELLDLSDEIAIAESRRTLRRNLFQIANAVSQGQVEKLIVRNDLNLFGHFDSKTGFLTMHPHDKNHEDDDILDDLAQEVLNRGGEVIVTSPDEIPDCQTALALLRPSNPGIRKTLKFKQSNQIKEMRQVL